VVAHSWRESDTFIPRSVVRPIQRLMALEISTAVAVFVAAVIAEYIVGLKGLGYFILYDSRTFHQNEAAVAVLALSLLGVAINSAAGLATRRLLPWYRPS